MPEVIPKENKVEGLTEGEGHRKSEETKGSKDKEDKETRGRKGESLQMEDDEREEAETPGKEDAENPGAEDAETEEVSPPPEGDFEVRDHKIGRRPVLPTKAEIDRHYPLHLEYRSWCTHCVAGKARSTQHKKAEENKEKLGVTWNVDYAFMGG